MTDDFGQLTALVEALLFVSERPVPLKELAAFLPEAGEDRLGEAMSALSSRYATTQCGLQMELVAGGYRLSTRPDLGDAVKEFFRLKNRQKLSRAALETLAIVAYKQPVTHPEIQEIRGVSAEGVLRTLLERRLIRIQGRKDTVGKPLLYGTTRGFLEHFGLASLDDLPPVEEFGDMLGEGSTASLGEVMDRLPGGDVGVILPLEAAEDDIGPADEVEDGDTVAAAEDRPEEAAAEAEGQI